MATPRVLFLIDKYLSPNAGTEGQLLMLIRGLQAQGYEVELAVLRQSEFLTQSSFVCPVHCLHILNMRSPVYWWRLLRFLFGMKKRGFRLLHIFFPDSSVMAPPLAKLLGMRVIVSRRDMGFWHTPAFLWALKAAKLFVDKVVACCDAVQQVVIQREGFAPKQSCVIYNGYEPVLSAVALSLPSSPSETVLVQAAEHPSLLPKLKGKPVIAIVANIRPVKRIEDLLEAVARVSKDYPEIQLLIAGGGEQQALRLLAKQYNITAQVHFLGQLDTVEPVLQCADILALTSASEGLSNALLEYMAAGKAIVCSQTGGNSELVEQGKNGLLYPPGDVEALTQALLQLLADPLLRQRFGVYSQARIRTAFSKEQLIHSHMALYRALVPQC